MDNINKCLKILKNKNMLNDDIQKNNTKNIAEILHNKLHKKNTKLIPNTNLKINSMTNLMTNQTINLMTNQTKNQTKNQTIKKVLFNQEN